MDNIATTGEIAGFYWLVMPGINAISGLETIRQTSFSWLLYVNVATHFIWFTTFARMAECGNYTWLVWGADRESIKK